MTDDPRPKTRALLANGTSWPARAMKVVPNDNPSVRNPGGTAIAAMSIKQDKLEVGVAPKLVLGDEKRRAARWMLGRARLIPLNVARSNSA